MLSDENTSPTETSAFRPVRDHRDADMRRAGWKSSGRVAEGIGGRLFDDLLRHLVELVCSSKLPPSSSTCIWKPPAWPMPWIGGGASTIAAPSGQIVELALNMFEDRQEILALGLFAIGIGFEDHIFDAGIGERRRYCRERIGRRSRSHSPRPASPRRSLSPRSSAAVVRPSAAPSGNCDGDHRIALILIGNEGGRQTRDAPKAEAPPAPSRSEPSAGCSAPFGRSARYSRSPSSVDALKPR